MSDNAGKSTITPPESMSADESSSASEVTEASNDEEMTDSDGSSVESRPTRTARKKCRAEVRLGVLLVSINQLIRTIPLLSTCCLQKAKAKVRALLVNRSTTHPSACRLQKAKAKVRVLLVNRLSTHLSAHHL